MKLILRVAEIAFLALVALYFGDYLSARYRLPGNRQTLSNVQVKTMWVVRMKNGRSDYSMGDTVTQTCVWSLFPQMGYTPCWYLNRHTTRIITVSRVGGSLIDQSTICNRPGFTAAIFVQEAKPAMQARCARTGWSA